MTSNKCVSSNYGCVRQTVSKYDWIILDSTHDFVVGEFICSPELFFGNKAEFKFQLILYPCGKVRESSISLYLKSLNELTVKISGKLYNNRSDLIEKFDCVLNPFCEWGYEDFSKSANNQKLKRKRCLNQQKFSITISCAISSIKILDCFNMQKASTMYETLKDFDEQLFQNGNFFDVKIIVDTKEFRAHKAILAARSVVFEAMFKNNMIEKKTNLVTINNIDHEIFKEMLRFIYTGQIRNIEKIAKHLLMAADEYAVQGLKNLCSEQLCKTVNVNNAVDLLLFADIYDLKLLKQQTFHVITNNPRKISNMPEFKLLEGTPKLLTELYIELAAKTRLVFK